MVVVDDASTDGSQDIILAFGQRVTPVLKVLNAGHGAAFNSGFAASRGEIVFFLDADDHLYPRAVELVVREFAPGVAKVQYRLDLVDAAGRIIDSFPPPEVQFDDGDVVPLLLSTGRYEGKSWLLAAVFACCSPEMLPWLVSDSSAVDSWFESLLAGAIVR